MSVIYCHRCDRYVDSDFEETAVVADEEVCGDCLTDEEILASWEIDATDEEIEEKRNE